ncbi:MAG TPA: PorV/PorQ family protein [Bacteroidota bacterium]|nr:PorV/PorQ family protein [Bacteroidota bacterium]
MASKKHFLILLIVAGLLLVPYGSSVAQSFQNAGSTGMQFLKIGMSARAEGMGGAFASVAGDISSLTINPASIGSIDQIGVSVQHTSWVAETNLNFIGLVVPISDDVNLALHTTYLTTGDIEITTIDQPEGTGQFYNASDIAVGLTSSIRLTSQLTFATTFNYLQERIYDEMSGGVSLDVGMWYSTGFKSLNIGFVISNLGFDQNFEGHQLDVQYVPSEPSEPPVNAELQTLDYSLPLSFRASGSFDVFEMFGDKLTDSQLLMSIDFVQNADTPERVLVGIEYGWYKTLFLRGGYVANADELGLAGGIGTMVAISGADVQFDVAASSLGRFGLSYRFGVAVLSN